MKRMILFLAVLSASLFSAQAEPENSKNLYRQNYDFRDFTALSVSHIFKVDLRFADAWSVEVEVPDYIEPYLDVNCREGKVRIGLHNLPKNIQRRLNDENGQLNASVTMPKILSLNMSGATALIAQGTPALADGESLRIVLSGASKLESLQAASRGQLTLNMSGASKAEIEADFRSFDIDMSGASKLQLTGNADGLEIDCSGASKANLSGGFDKAEVGVSGSSDVTVHKDIRLLELEVSGASKFEVKGKTAIADVELSGASKARLEVTGEMTYELSGVSTLRVRDMDAKIRGEAARGSKIEYLK